MRCFEEHGGLWRAIVRRLLYTPRCWYTDILATSNNKETIIANLTSSETMNSAPSLAAHLLHMLVIRSYEPQDMARSSPSEKHPQPEPRLEASGHLNNARD